MLYFLGPVSPIPSDHSINNKNVESTLLTQLSSMGIQESLVGVPELTFTTPIQTLKAPTGYFSSGNSSVSTVNRPRNRSSIGPLNDTASTDTTNSPAIWNHSNNNLFQDRTPGFSSPPYDNRALRRSMSDNTPSTSADVSAVTTPSLEPLQLTRRHKVNVPFNSAAKFMQSPHGFVSPLFDCKSTLALDENRKNISDNVPKISLIGSPSVSERRCSNFDNASRFAIPPSPSIMGKRNSLINGSLLRNTSGESPHISRPIFNALPRSQATRNLSSVSIDGDSVPKKLNLGVMSVTNENMNPNNKSPFSPVLNLNRSSIFRNIENSQSLLSPPATPCTPNQNKSSPFSKFSYPSSTEKRSPAEKISPAKSASRYASIPVFTPPSRSDKKCVDNFFSPNESCIKSSNLFKSPLPLAPIRVSNMTPSNFPALPPPFQPTPDQSVFDFPHIRRKTANHMPSTPARPQLTRRTSLMDTKLLFSNVKGKTIYDGLTPTPKSPNPISASPMKSSNSKFSFEDEFYEIHKIGEGSFFEVFSARSYKDKQVYAIKKSKNAFRSKNDRKKYLGEVESLVEVGANNANIVELFNCWQEDGHFYLQLEYCKSSLSQIMKNATTINEELVNQVLHDVATGLLQIHSHDVVHMDIKPDNILLGLDGNFKICDFGSAVLKNKTTVDTSESDCVYIAPELFMNEQLEIPPSTSADIFSLGLLLFEMISSYALPLNGKEWHFLREGGVSEILNGCSISNELKQTIIQMVDKSPNNRPTASELVQSNHINSMCF